MLDERIKPMGNKKVKQKVKDFCKFVDENKAKKFYICSHDNPDSIGSSFGMSRIFHFLGVQETGI